jgi:hypothetical protein
MNRIGLWISSLLVVFALLSSTLFVVDQRQFGVVYALGQIKEVITEPGLHFKLPPPLQNVNYIDKRLLTLDSPENEPMLTAEKQRVVIDWYVRWRITDPQAYIRNVGLDEKAGTNQLNRVVRNAFQEEINKRTVNELLSLKREELMDDVKAAVLVDHLLDVLHGIRALGSALGLGFKAGGQGVPGLDIEVALGDGGEVRFTPRVLLGAEQRFKAVVVLGVIGWQFELVVDGFSDD